MYVVFLYMDMKRWHLQRTGVRGFHLHHFFSNLKVSTDFYMQILSNVSHDLYKSHYYLFLQLKFSVKILSVRFPWSCRMPLRFLLPNFHEGILYLICIANCNVKGFKFHMMNSGESSIRIYSKTKQKCNKLCLSWTI